MDVKVVFDSIKEFVPVPVIIAVVCCIMLVNISKKIVKEIEDYMECKYQKQIRFFDHKKIWLCMFWAVILSATLAMAGFIAWNELLLYMFEIMGASTFFYEAFLKKMGINDD